MASNEVPKIQGYDNLTLERTGSLQTVWKAYDSANNRYVAIKLPILQKLIEHSEDDCLDGLRREEEALGRLDGDGVPKLHEGLVNVDVAYSKFTTKALVMEWVDEPSIEDLVQNQEALTIEQSIYLAQNIVRLLARAHQAGLVIRDLKPEDVRLGPIGGPDWQSKDVPPSPRLFLVDLGNSAAPDDTDLKASGQASDFRLASSLLLRGVGAPVSNTLAKELSDGPLPSDHSIWRHWPVGSEENRDLSDPWSRLQTLAQDLAAYDAENAEFLVRSVSELAKEIIMPRNNRYLGRCLDYLLWAGHLLRSGAKDDAFAFRERIWPEIQKYLHRDSPLLEVAAGYNREAALILEPPALPAPTMPLPDKLPEQALDSSEDSTQEVGPTLIPPQENDEVDESEQQSLPERMQHWLGRFNSAGVVISNRGLPNLQEYANDAVDRIVKSALQLVRESALEDQAWEKLIDLVIDYNLLLTVASQPDLEHVELLQNLVAMAAEVKGNPPQRPRPAGSLDYLAQGLRHDLRNTFFFQALPEAEDMRPLLSALSRLEILKWIGSRTGIDPRMLPEDLLRTIATPILEAADHDLLLADCVISLQTSAQDDRFRVRQAFDSGRDWFNSLDETLLIGHESFDSGRGEDVVAAGDSTSGNMGDMLSNGHSAYASWLESLVHYFNRGHSLLTRTTHESTDKSFTAASSMFQGLVRHLESQADDNDKVDMWSLNQYRLVLEELRGDSKIGNRAQSMWEGFRDLEQLMDAAGVHAVSNRAKLKDLLTPADSTLFLAPQSGSVSSSSRWVNRIGAWIGDHRRLLVYGIIGTIVIFAMLGISSILSFYVGQQSIAAPASRESLVERSSVDSQLEFTTSVPKSVLSSDPFPNGSVVTSIANPNNQPTSADLHLTIAGPHDFNQEQRKSVIVPARAFYEAIFPFGVDVPGSYTGTVVVSSAGNVSQSEFEFAVSDSEK